MTRFVFLFMTVWLISGCQTTYVSQQNDLMAPTAVLLSERSIHHGVLDGSTSLNEWVCLKNETGGAISIVLEIKKPKIEGVMSVVNGEGNVVKALQLKPRQHIYEVFDRIGSGKISRCVVLQPSKGLSVYSLRWRMR